MELTPKEFELLLYLAKNKGRVLTRDQLLSAVWNYDFAGDTRIVDVHISHLREKIERNTKKPTYIKTIRGLAINWRSQKENDIVSNETFRNAYVTPFTCFGCSWTHAWSII